MWSPFYPAKENNLVLVGLVLMHPAVYTTATPRIGEVEAASKFPNKDGVIIASTAVLLLVLFWVVTLVSKLVVCLNG